MTVGVQRLCCPFCPPTKYSRLQGTSSSRICARRHVISGRKARVSEVKLSFGSVDECRPTLSQELWLMAAIQLIGQPAIAAELSEGGFSQGSYYVTLGLFVVTLPGLWSLIKRSAKSKVRRKVFEVDGPGKEGAVALDSRASSIAQYFLKYNYDISETGEVIKFVGNYQSSKSQAFSLVLYTFISLASAALVLSIQFPTLGNWWYLVTLVSPLAGAYYWQNSERQEEVKVKITTTDDELTTDIIVEGDEEELDRFSREMEMVEKGKIKVKGILEN